MSVRDCEWGHLTLAKALLERGPVVDHPIDGGLTPLFIAPFASKLLAEKALLERGAVADRVHANDLIPLIVWGEGRPRTEQTLEGGPRGRPQPRRGHLVVRGAASSLFKRGVPLCRREAGQRRPLHGRS